MRRIIISWATIRPKMFTSTYKQWKAKASSLDFITYAGCNTDEQVKEFLDLNPMDKNLIVKALGDNIKGVPSANYALLQQIDFRDDDIIIVGADDFVPPQKWDQIILDCFRIYDGTIIFEDGNPEKFRSIITLPVLTGRLLKKLNKIIYHPEYRHNYADNEFFANVTELNEVVDLRYSKPNIVFEHRHWIFQKRSKDSVDNFAVENVDNDRLTWERRRTLSIEERLKV